MKLFEALWLTEEKFQSKLLKINVHSQSKSLCFVLLKELKNDDQCSLIDDQIIVVPEFSAMHNLAGKLTMSRTIRNTQLILIMW